MKTNFLTGFATLMMTVLLLLSGRSYAIGPSCDFDGDGNCDIDDLDALTAAIAGGSTDLSFDMNGDGVISGNDLLDPTDGWLTVGGWENPDVTGGNAFIQGDTNLDGNVDVSDFNNWNVYKFSLNTDWSGGNVNADALTDVADWNLWNLNKFTSSSDLGLVPEPTAVCLAAIALIGLTRVMRTR